MGLIDERGIRAVIFDLDGTLIDSHASVERSWKRLANAMEIEYATAPFVHGVPSLSNIRSIAPGISDVDALAWNRIHLQMEIDDTEGVVALEGALPLLRALESAHVPWAIATGCQYGLGEARQGAAGLPRPEVFVMFGDYTVGKPAPDPFLVAAERLGVDPAMTIVVEDAPSGVTAGLAAGALVVAVAETHDRSELAAAHFIVDDLHELLDLLLG